MIMEKVDQLFRVIMKFAILNLLWLGFSVIGFIVIGFFPATVAMFVIVRKWVRGEEQIPIFQVFWSIYKQVFLKANLFGWVLSLIGGLFYVNYQLMIALGTDVPFIVVLAFLLLVLLYFLFIVSLLPVAVHFSGGVKQIIKKAILFMFARIHLALLLLVLVWTSVYLSIAFPTILLFFTGSVLSYMMMWFFHRSLDKIEQNKPKEQYSS
ncbi:YesL family protein [Halalkalibacter sp. APA_J-10(15)]|uniref:YesL family protein n=1 Tax=unclassified Halalkalibacter TaxID=2893063 RepID=UPI001FF12DC3|nr:DUF624 domain-containing protein [Halalkalibacter sp. APA_J-10(15)]MCK0471741.1 DUF624 domain-containing protein [Halalkalibacter sp. APA_J-10(15)]